jgi:transposase
MYYVGLDIHHRSTSAEILDCNGKLVKRTEWKLPWPQLADQLKKETPAPFAVCFEASCGYGFLYEQFSSVAQQVKAAHPGSLRLIYKSKRKNNRVDAGKLARLLYLDAVPSVYVPGKETRLWRQTIEFRQTLLTRLVTLKNQIRASLRERGIATPKGLWTVKGTTWFATQGESDDAWTLRRDLLIEELRELKKKIKRVDLQLKSMSSPRPGVALLMTIPGIGPRSAEALAAYIDNANRFSSTRKAGSYFGWDPCQDASADKNRLGHITRDGPPTVRKLMVEAAWQGVRRSPTIKAFYDRVIRNDPDRKKIAIVATAHHMTRVAVSMLKSGEVWREDPRLSQGKRENQSDSTDHALGGSAPKPPPRKPLPPAEGTPE